MVTGPDGRRFFVAAEATATSGDPTPGTGNWENRGIERVKPTKVEGDFTEKPQVIDYDDDLDDDPNDVD